MKFWGTSLFCIFALLASCKTQLGSADGNGPDVDGATSDSGDSCPAARDCNGFCCPDGYKCEAGTCVVDCGVTPACGGVCCGDGFVCESNLCMADCASPELRCGPTNNLCCGDGQACLSHACVDLGIDCTVTEDCGIDEICEPNLGKCVPEESVGQCKFIPPVGEFSPSIACQWKPPAGSFASYDDVVMTPSVANMTDDNTDGATDTLDIPDLVFISFDRQADGCCTANGVIQVVSGACNPDGTMNTLATLGSPFVGNSSGIALGNLDPDSDANERAPEIVATMKNGGTIAYKRTAADGSAWTELWRNDTLPNNNHTRGGAQPSLADVNGDGSPEVIIGNVVLNGQTGAKIWDGRETVSTSAGIGNNAFLGPTGTIADIDLDGQLEVIAGNTCYNAATGAEEWTYAYTTSNSTCQGSIPCDGFNAVGNFDADAFGEVVIVRLGEVFVLNHDGTLLHQAQVPHDNCIKNGNIRNESGPPTVADFDGDGRPEIGTAGADFYAVIDFDCTGTPLPDGCESENVLWKVTNQDCSSRATGSSVFDFEGDGVAEVVYADETTFRIFDGRNGNILYEDTSHSSNTRMEMPIVVDVDNDGKSEVIVPEPNRNSVDLGGIEIWEDADNNWVRTRRIWNQHAYYVTGITEDGQVPRTQENNWQNERLNNFRQNVQPDGLFDAPDLTITGFTVDSCTSSSITVRLTVENLGALGTPPGIDVFARALKLDDTLIDAKLVQTQTLILPGQSEVVLVVFEDSDRDYDDFKVEALVDDDGMGNSQYNECDELNNTVISDTLDVCTIID